MGLLDAIGAGIAEAGGAVANIGMAQVKSAIEEERSNRIAELQSQVRMREDDAKREKDRAGLETERGRVGAAYKDIESSARAGLDTDREAYTRQALGLPEGAEVTRQMMDETSPESGKGMLHRSYQEALRRGEAGLVGEIGKRMDKEDERDEKYSAKEDERRIHEEKNKRDDEFRRWQTEENAKMRRALQAGKSGSSDPEVYPVQEAYKAHLSRGPKESDYVVKSEDGLSSKVDLAAFDAATKRWEGKTALLGQKLMFLASKDRSAYAEKIADNIRESAETDAEVATSLKQLRKIDPRLAAMASSHIDMSEVEPAADPAGKSGGGGGVKGSVDPVEPAKPPYLAREIPIDTLKKFVDGGLLGRGGVFRTQ